RVEDDGRGRVDGLVQPAHELRLVVGLAQVDLDRVARLLDETHPQRGEILVAVDVGLAAPETTEIGTVEHHDARHGSSLARLPPRSAAAISSRSPGRPRTAATRPAPAARSVDRCRPAR